ncbi:MAG: ABC transporter permease [Eubacterium sp.]|nr:ABC transporter permease [Eubacterium sp.]
MLRKRVLRQLKNNIMAYFALFLLIALGMFFVVSTIASADTIYAGMEEYIEDNNVEDGEFTSFMEIEDDTIDLIKDEGIEIEKQNYTDYDAGESTVRVFENREKLNLVEVIEGDIAKEKDEVALEQHYAEANDIEIGSTVEIGGVELKVTGFVCSPDYETCLKELSDPSVDSESFGTAFMTQEGYECLSEEGEAQVAETIRYAYALGDDMTDSELKDLLEDEDVVVLSMYPADQNGRIGEAEDDVSMNRVTGIVGGIIIFILIGFVISIFQTSKIDKESTIIGTMYALGLTKGQMIRHYLATIFIVTFLGGIVGVAVGFTEFGFSLQLDSVVNYYSIPTLTPVYPMYLIAYGILVPAGMVVLVNFFVLNKKLGQQPLVLLRHQKNHGKTAKLQFKSFKFKTGFMLRQLIREYRCRIAMIVGVFLSVLLIMMAMNIHVCISNLIEQNEEDCNFEYMYFLKGMPEEIPENAYAAYVKKYTCDAADGSNITVSIIGIDEDNPYFEGIEPEGRKLILSSSVAIKMDMDGEGEITLEDIVEDEEETFDVSGVTQYSFGTYAFMDIDEMREYFDVDEDYYNILFSDEELDIDSELIYSETSKDDIRKFAEVLSDNMAALTYMTAVIALLIFVVVIYLMMKFIMDSSEFAISLMRIFGYAHGELYRLYMAADIIIFAIILVISVFSGKAIMDAIWPNFVAHVSVGLDLTYTWKHYAAVFVFAAVTYAIISAFLSAHLKTMEKKAVEVLKERE